MCFDIITLSKHNLKGDNMFIVIGASGTPDCSIDTFVVKERDSDSPIVFTTIQDAIDRAVKWCHVLIEQIITVSENKSKSCDDQQRNTFNINIRNNIVTLSDSDNTWELRVVPLVIPKNDYEIHRTGFHNFALWCKGNPINITSSQVVVDSWKKQFNIV